MAPPEDKTIMRSLGEFFGHVWQGVRAKPGETKARRVTHESEQRETENGSVTLRRTIIEEVELPPRKRS